MRTRSASRSSASATAPTRCSRASSTTRTPTRTQFVPGLMHVDLGGYHVRDVEFTAAFDVTAGQGRQGPRRRDLGASERHDQVRRRAQDRHHRLARHDARRARQVHLRSGPQGVRRHRRRRRDPPRDRHRRGRQLPPRRLRGSDQVVHRADPAGRLRDGELHAGVHRQGRPLPAALRGCRPADHRRRHQVAGRRDHHPPRAHVPLPRARRPARQDHAAERRRQLRLPEHARARAPRVEEDLEDERGHVDARLRHRRARTSTSARPTTCPGSPTASGRTSGWRARPSATSRSTSSSSSRSGTRRTRPGSSSTPSGSRSWR